MALVVIQPKSGSNPCASCKDLYGRTCCEVKDSTAPFFPLTYAEASRIAKHFGIPIQEAVTLRTVTSEEKRALYDAAGYEVANLVVGDKALYLPVENDRCRYLAKDGCSIPYIKPHLCALFPFARKNGRWTVGANVPTSKFCFGLDASGRSTKKALEIFGETTSNLDYVERRWERDRRTHSLNLRRLVEKR